MKKMTKTITTTITRNEDKVNNNLRTIEITSDCTCEVYDEELDDSKKDEYGDPIRPEYCYGDCYSMSVEDLNEMFIKPYAEAKKWDTTDTIKVEVSSIGWQRRSGYTLTTLDGLLETLQINGDFRIQFRYDIETNELTAVRYSHDEPVGTGVFEITARFLPCEKCGDPVEESIHAEELGFCVDCQHEYFDHSDEE